MKQMPRTDLAAEVRDILREASANEISGVEFSEEKYNGINYHILELLTDEASEKMGKPKGVYCSVEIEPVMRRDSDIFPSAVQAAASLIRRFMPENSPSTVLVAGLGNRSITPDAVGPLATDATLVTRHLKQFMPRDFAAFRDVAVITPGVLGTTGIESAVYIKSICDAMHPDWVIVIDALAAGGMDRLCRTLQITNTGITPGSGVGNSRNAINTETLGVPVVAVGVPTVVDLRSLLPDSVEALPTLENGGGEMIVTPRGIDSQVACIGRVIGYAVNLALHDGITISDIDLLLG
ncbi:MAG: GPR endopeptidase [Oscillospiraceae bacterium]|jgi:spore protease|nr:GPR endopeptidase [Oscillospiraceae bacterium]